MGQTAGRNIGVGGCICIWTDNKASARKAKDTKQYGGKTWYRVTTTKGCPKHGY